MNETKTITIPANGVYTENFGAASCFYCVDATTVFRFRAGNGKAVELGREKKHGGKGGKALGAVTFYNDSSAANIVTFYVGTEEFTGSATRIYVQDAPTYTKASGTLTAVVGVGGETYNGTDPDTGCIRKQIAITNLNTVASGIEIIVTDGDSVAGNTIQPKQTWTMITSGIVKVFDDGVTDGDYSVMETFYS